MSITQEDATQGLPSADNDAYSIDTSGIDSPQAIVGGKPATNSSRRILIIVLVIVVVAAAAFGATRLFSHGPGSTATTTTLASSSGLAGTTSTSSVSVGTNSPTGSSGQSGSAQVNGLPSIPYQVYTTRDPFTPVALPVLSGDGQLFGIALNVGAASSSSSSTTTQVTASTLPSSGSTSTSTTNAQAPAGPPPSTTHTIELISIFTSNGQPTANVTVDSQGYQVYDGEVFDGNFTVVILSTATGCGTFLYADYEFQLCEGQQAQV